MRKIKNVKVFNKATKIILPAVISMGIAGSISTIFGNTPFAADEYEEYKLHNLDINQKQSNILYTIKADKEYSDTHLSKIWQKLEVMEPFEYVNPNESYLCESKVRVYDVNNDNVSKELINALLNDDFEWINDHYQYSEEIEKTYIEYAGNIDHEDYVKAYINVKENVIEKRQNGDDVTKEVALLLILGCIVASTAYLIVDKKEKNRTLSK